MEQNHNSLYRVYRPSSFKDVAGHQNIVEILQTQLKNQTFSHAFLFAGQRGTGKTSIARILAKAVNCLNLQAGNPCNQCENCLAFNENKFSDVYEIDAASNNGVDEIRNIKTNVSTLPIIGKYKVYIIDEVHMLSKAAFNALLKTLEEPPMHVIFVLATTEYDKIPQTITSRCQSFNFKKITSHDLTNRLNFICQKEGYKLDQQVSREIYNLSDGSLRDALNVLEQLMILSSDHQISMKNLKKIFYVTTKAEKLNLLSLIFNQDANQVVTYFERAKNQGLDFDVFSLSLIKLVKEIIEFQLTKNVSLLTELEVNEATRFSSVKLNDLFLLTDYLTNAYSKTKSHSISYDAIILSIIQSMQNFSQPYQLEIDESVEVNQDFNEVEPENFEVEFDEVDQNEPETVPTVEWTQDIVKDLIKGSQEEVEVENNIIVHEDETDFSEVGEPTIIDNFISKTKPKLKPIVNLNNEVPTNLLGLIRKQNELVLVQEQLNQPIEFLIEDLINVLRGAVNDQTILLRKDLNTKITKLFLTNDQSDLLNAQVANRFIVFYNSKVVVANKHELILTVDDQMIANLINHWLLDQTNREDFFELLGHAYVIYAVSEELWNETKTAHVRLKNKEMLPNYKPTDLETFYQNNQTKAVQELDEENQELIDKVANLFGQDDIKIG